MAYKFQLGAARLSGSIVVEDSFEADASVVDSLDVQNGGITQAGAIAGATSIDGSGDLTMGTITMTGFAVDADGDTALKSLAVDDGSTIGPDSVTDLITLAGTGNITIKDGAYDFDIAAHDGTNGLKLGGTLVAASAAELNLVDGSSAGAIVNSKAVIYGSSGEVNADSLQIGGVEAISSTGNFSGANASFNEVTASGDVFLSGSTLKIPDVATVSFDLADSMLLHDDADDKMKRITLANYASAIAGDGLAASSGVLAVGVDGSSIEISGDALQVRASGITNDMLAGSIADSKLSTISTADKVSLSAIDLDGASDIGADLVDADLIFVDDGAGGTNRKSTMGRIPVYLNDHASLTSLNAVTSATALASVGALNAGSITSGFGAIDNGSSAITTTGTGSFGKVIVSGDLIVQGTTTQIDSTQILVTGSISFEGATGDAYETTLGVVDPTADRSILLPNIDGNLAAFSDSSFQSAASAITLTELEMLDADTAGSSVELDGADSLIIGDNSAGNQTKKVLMSDVAAYVGDNLAVNVQNVADTGTLQVGVNYFSDMGLDGEDSVTLPASPSAGQSVKVKAPSDCSAARYITINSAGSQTIDGELSIRLESPFAAVELVYVAADLWRVF